MYQLTNYVQCNQSTYLPPASFAIDQSIYIPAVYHALSAVYNTIHQLIYQLCASCLTYLPTSCVQCERAHSKKWMWEKGFFGMPPMACVPARTSKQAHSPLRSFTPL